MIPRKPTQATQNRTIAPTVNRLLALAKVAGLHLTTGELLRRHKLIEGSRRDRGLSE